MTAALVLAPGDRWHEQVVQIGDGDLRLDARTGRTATLRLLPFQGYAVRVAATPGITVAQALAALTALPEEDLERIIAYRIEDQ